MNTMDLPSDIINIITCYLELDDIENVNKIFDIENLDYKWIVCFKYGYIDKNMNYINYCRFLAAEHICNSMEMKQSNLNVYIYNEKYFDDPNPNLKAIELYESKVLHINNKRFNNKIFKLCGLERLTLTHFNLNKISDDISCLNNLKCLNLSFNKIKHISLEIFELVHLDSLGLGFNEIEVIPLEIKNLVDLTYLELSSNKITDIKNIAELLNLRYVRLQSNPITCIPDEMTRLNKLETFYISMYGITKRPSDKVFGSKIRD